MSCYGKLLNKEFLTILLSHCSSMAKSSNTTFSIPKVFKFRKILSFTLLGKTNPITFEEVLKKAKTTQNAGSSPWCQAFSICNCSALTYIYLPQKV